MVMVPTGVFGSIPPVRALRSAPMSFLYLLVFTFCGPRPVALSRWLCPLQAPLKDLLGLSQMDCPP
eukprot:scaffold477126_cov15-Prasinocladus_malaysianus.AAC.1